MVRFYYLYCLKSLPARAGKNQPKFSMKGLGGKKIDTLDYQDITAVITEVSSKEFDPEIVKEKLEKDIKWTEEKARNHQVVIEEAMEENTVIPLKFLTLYRTKEKIKQILKEKYNDFRKLLNKLQRKEEWGVKVYLVDREKLIAAVQKEDEELSTLQEKIAGKPEGTKYFFEKKMEEKIKQKLDGLLDEYIREIFDVLAPFSTEKPVVNKLLPEEVIDKTKKRSFGKMVSNSSYLIPKEKVGEFQGTIKRIHQHIYFPKGLWLEYSGPWPPYSFVGNIKYEEQNK